MLKEGETKESRGWKYREITLDLDKKMEVKLVNKYKALSDVKIMQELYYAVIFRAVQDYLNANEIGLKRDASNFLKGEDCEIMCYIVKLDYYFLLKLLGLNQDQVKERRMKDKEIRIIKIKNKSSMRRIK